MTLLTCLAPQGDCAGIQPDQSPLGQSGLQPLRSGDGLRRQQALGLDLLVARRGLAGARLSLSRSGPARQGRTSLLQAIVATGGRGWLALGLDLPGGLRANAALDAPRVTAGIRSRAALPSEGGRGLRDLQRCPAGSLVVTRVEPPSRRILLAGEDLTRRLGACSLRQDRDDPHLRLTLEAVDASLAPMLDAARLEAAPALVLELAGQARSFVIEAVTVQDHLLEVQAAGISILQDAPHARPVTLGPLSGPLSGPCSAREAAAALLAPAPLDWDMEDYLLPAETALQDAPVPLATRIAAAAGGVLHARGDGGFRIRKRHPHGPAALARARASLQVRADENLLGLTVTDDPGQPWGAVQVLGASPAATLPLVELEWASGSMAMIRVTWREQGPERLRLSPWVSSGSVHSLGAAVEAVAERLDFVNGQATASRPVLELLGPPVWLGQDGGAVLAQPRSEVLLAPTGGHGLADVRYLTGFDRYLLRDVAVSEALFVLGVAPANAVAVTARSALRPGRPVHPDLLEMPLAGTQRAALLAGEAWLLEHCLPVRSVVASLPFSPGVTNDSDGMVFHLHALEAGVAGHFTLTGWTLRCEGAASILTLEGRTWRV